MIRGLVDRYGDDPAEEFGPLKLEVVREGWVVAGLSRNEVNRRAAMVKRMFKWAVSKQRVPAHVFTALATRWRGVLEKGRTSARETEPVGPVDEATVDATLPFLEPPRSRSGRVPAALTGCRPGEACALRMIDVGIEPVRSGCSDPPNTKRRTAGSAGPSPSAPRHKPCSPRSSVPIRQRVPVRPAGRGRGDARRSGREPQDPALPLRCEANSKEQGEEPESRRATRQVFHPCVQRGRLLSACEDAFPLSEQLARRAGETAKARNARLMDEQKKEFGAWRKAHHWHPNQLRHSFATAVRKQHGLEAAQVLLGHSRADVDSDLRGEERCAGRSDRGEDGVKLQHGLTF